MQAPPCIRATHPCPACGGRLVVKRCPTAHRKALICACGYKERLPLTIRLRLAGMPELPLFETEVSNL